MVYSSHETQFVFEPEAAISTLQTYQGLAVDACIAPDGGVTGWEWFHVKWKTTAGVNLSV